MREIILDTETTGLYLEKGDRVIEMACVELQDGKPARHWHRYFNPQREMEKDTINLHGISNEFLVGYPVFADEVGDFLQFVDMSVLYIHNAPFDVAFINAELERAGLAGHMLGQRCQVIDTYRLALANFPGQRNTLAALAERFDLVMDETFPTTLRHASMLAQILPHLKETA